MSGVHGPPQRTHGDHDNNVKVFVRVKPLKRADQMHSCLEVQGAKSITIGGRNQFTYDSVLGENCTQEDMFQAVGKSMTENCLRGYNGTVFAYGQTGSGKTFTIQGPDAPSAASAVQDPQRGLAPRILQNLFALINRDVNNSGGNHVYTVKCSLFEIYNEQITDLLQPHVTNLTVYDKPNHGTVIDGAKEQEVTSAEEAIKLLLSAAKHRHVSSTGMNDQSSRSHMIFSVYIRATKRALGERPVTGSAKSNKKRSSHSTAVTKVQYSRLNLVDLAGSERQKQTKATGQRLKEAMSINKSLTNLALVIRALVDVAKGKQAHVHYRDSKLTYLLKDSLGGNSKTSIIATVNPLESSFQDSLATLTFASRAKMMKNKAVVNENVSTNVASLQMEVVRLRKELHAARAKAKSSPGATPLATPTPGPTDTSTPAATPMGVRPAGGMPAVQVPTPQSGLPLPQQLVNKESERLVQDLENRVVHLEKMLQTAMETDLKKIAEQKEREEKMAKLEKLAKENDRFLAANKLMLNMKATTIDSLLGSDEGTAETETVGEDVKRRREAEVREKEELVKEIQLLREQVEHHPKVTESELRLLDAKESLRNYDQMFTDDLVTYRDQVLQLEQARASLQKDVAELIEEKHGILRNISKAAMRSPRIGSPALASGRRYPIAAFSSPRIVKKTNEMEAWRQHMMGGDAEELRRQYEEARQQIAQLQEAIEHSNEEHHELEETLRRELASAESVVKLQEEVLQEMGSEGQKYTEEEVRELIESAVGLKEELELVEKQMQHKQDQLELVELELKETIEKEARTAARLEKALADVTNTMVTVEKQQELIQTLQSKCGDEGNRNATLLENQDLRKQLLDVTTTRDEQADELLAVKKALDDTQQQLEDANKKKELLMEIVASHEQTLAERKEVLEEKEAQLQRLLETEEGTEEKLADAEQQREAIALEVLSLRQQVKALQQDARDVDEIHRDQAEELKACVEEQLQELRQKEEALAESEQRLRLLELDLEVAAKEKQELQERVAGYQEQVRSLVETDEHERALHDTFAGIQARADERIADLEGLLVKMKKDQRRIESGHAEAIAELTARLERSQKDCERLEERAAAATAAAADAEGEKNALLQELESTSDELTRLQDIACAQEKGQRHVRKGEEETFLRCQRLEADNRQLLEKQEALQRELAAAKKSCELLSRRQ